MQQKKLRHPGRLAALALIVTLAVTIVVVRVQTAGVNQQTKSLRQELSAVIEANEYLKPISADAQAYQQQYDRLIKIAGAYADPVVVSSGLTSSAMENAAREEGFLFPREIVFENISKH